MNLVNITNILQVVIVQVLILPTIADNGPAGVMNHNVINLSKQVIGHGFATISPNRDRNRRLRTVLRDLCLCDISRKGEACQNRGDECEECEYFCFHFLFFLFFRLLFVSVCFFGTKLRLNAKRNCLYRICNHICFRRRCAHLDLRRNFRLLNRSIYRRNLIRFD